MAKKEKEITGSNLNDALAEFDPTGALVNDYEVIESTRYVSTGNYELNAHYSGSLLKGIPMGKITILCGDPKAGKSFVALNIAREAQAQDIFPWYFETENSQDKNRFLMQGIDIKKIRITQPETVQQLITTVLPFAEKQLKLKSGGKPYHKDLLIIVDSSTGLLPTGQLQSSEKGEYKADMGTAIQEFGFFLNAMSLKLGKLGWGCVVTTHSKIQEIKMPGRTFVKRTPKGGLAQVFMASIVGILTKKEVRDEDDLSVKIGLRVTSTIYESRYTKHQDVEFFLPYDRPMNPYEGLFKYCKWELCGISKGKWVQLVDFKKKLADKGVDTTINFDISDIVKLSKADQEFAPEMAAYLVKHRFITVDESVAAPGASYKFTKKYETIDYVKEVVPIPNPNSPKFIVETLPNKQFTYDEMIGSMATQIFTIPVLERMDVYVRKVFELQSRADDSEQDYFA